MAKRIRSCKSKNSESFSVIDDCTNHKTQRPSTFIVEKLGNLDSLKKKYNTDDRNEVVRQLKLYVDSLNNADNEDDGDLIVPISQKQLEKDKERSFNIGYFYLRNIFCHLGIKEICAKIQQEHSFKFDLFSILCDLVCTRIIFPGSKRSSYTLAHKFYKAPSYQLEDVYRSLPILSQHRYEIESALFENSDKIYNRDCSILYYDCTNFYFETEEEDDFRKYGKSKENRPNPIVQYGLFMDSKGIPIADITFEGNRNEQFSLRELEERLEKDFSMSKFIVCADAGLNGWENKVYNNKKRQGAYIVTQPIKKLDKQLKAWAIEPSNWKLLNSSTIFNINNLPETITINGVETPINDCTFYKDRWVKTEKKSTQTEGKYTLEEHLIVSYSPKYKKYQTKIRDKKIERAKKLLDNPGKIDTKNERDPRYYIASTSTTTTGEVAGQTHYEIDYEKIAADSRFDGFYAVATDLEDHNISLILKANKQRWEIEENFQIMKSEFKSRPIFVSTEEAINGHLLTCFLALLVYRLLEKEHLKEAYTCPELIDNLKSLNIVQLAGNNYIPSFKRTDFTDHLTREFGFELAREGLSQHYIKKFERVVNARNSTKLK